MDRLAVASPASHQCLRTPRLTPPDAPTAPAHGIVPFKRPMLTRLPRRLRAWRRHRTPEGRPMRLPRLRVQSRLPALSNHVRVPTPEDVRVPRPESNGQASAEAVEEGVLSNLPRTRPQRTTERRIASREGKRPARAGSQGQPRTAKADGAAAKGPPVPHGARAAGAHGAKGRRRTARPSDAPAPPPKREARPRTTAGTAKAPKRRHRGAASPRKPRKRAKPRARPLPSASRPARGFGSAPGIRERTVPQHHRPRPAPGRRRAGGRRRGDRRRGGQGGGVGGRAGPEGPLLAASPLAPAARWDRPQAVGPSRRRPAADIYSRHAEPSCTCTAGGGPIAGRTVRSAGANRSEWTVAPHRCAARARQLTP